MYDGFIIRLCDVRSKNVLLFKKYYFHVSSFFEIFVHFVFQNIRSFFRYMDTKNHQNELIRLAK